MNNIKKFPKFVKKLFYEHDISKANLNINNTQKTILMLIDIYGDKSMSQISKEAGLEKSSFTRSIDKLVQNGFLIKEHSEKDQRIVYINFTKKGLKAVKFIKNDWNSYFKSLISVLTNEEKKEFFRAINVVSKYINKIIK